MSRSAGRPLRLLVVNWLDRENPQAGGAEEHLHQIFGRLAGQGHQVTALVSGWPGCAPRTTLDGIEVLRAGGRHTFSFAAPLHYRRHLRERDFDLLIEDLNKIPVFAPLWSRHPVVLLVHHLFGGTAFQEASLPFAAVTWLLERTVPWFYGDLPVVAVSESTRIDLARRGLDPSRVEVVHNGVDLERYRPDPAVDRFDRPTLLYLGRLKKYKRIDLILRAVEVLAHRGSDARLLVAGKGEIRPELERLSGRLGIEDRVQFLGFVDDETKLELFRRSWIHLLTSPKEGWGITNLEAAACGTPTVASDSPGLRDSVVDGETGLLVPHGDIPALANAIGRLLDDPDLLGRLGRQARAHAERFGWDAAADRTARLLSGLRGGT